MLLAPLGLLLVAAAYNTLQARAAREWPSTAGKVAVSNAEVRKVKVMDGGREGGRRFEERNFANIVYEYSVAGRSCATTASASARIAAISRLPRPSRVIRSVRSSPSITTRFIRTRRCWNATCQRGCGAASGSAPRSCLRSCSVLRSACIKSANLSRGDLPIPNCRRWSSPWAPSVSWWRCSRSPCSGKHRWRGNGRWYRAPSSCRKSRSTVPRRPGGKARAGHVSAEGFLQLHLEQDFIYQHARQPREQRRLDLELVGAQVHVGHGRTAPRSRFTSIRPIHRKQRSGRAPASSGSCGSVAAFLAGAYYLAVHG